jgi:hypothetical protein
LGRKRKITTREIAVNGPKYAITGQGDNRILRKYTGTDALDPKTSEVLGNYVESVKVTAKPKQLQKLLDREIKKARKRPGHGDLEYVVHDEKRKGDNITVTCYLYIPEAAAKNAVAGFKLKPEFA